MLVRDELFVNRIEVIPSVVRLARSVILSSLYLYSGVPEAVAHGIPYYSLVSGIHVPVGVKVGLVQVFGVFHEILGYLDSHAAAGIYPYKTHAELSQGQVFYQYRAFGVFTLCRRCCCEGASITVICGSLFLYIYVEPVPLSRYIISGIPLHLQSCAYVPGSSVRMIEFAFDIPHIAGVYPRVADR